MTGSVDETGLFGSQLRLTTTYTTLPGSNRLAVRTLRRLVLSRATMVYGDDEELDSALARLA